MKKEIKNIFQESFDGYESAIDTQDLLAGIAAKRKKNKKEKKFLWWVLPASLMVVILVVLATTGNENLSKSAQMVSGSQKFTTPATTINMDTKGKEHLVELKNEKEPIELESKAIQNESRSASKKEISKVIENNSEVKQSQEKGYSSITKTVSAKQKESQAWQIEPEAETILEESMPSKATQKLVENLSLGASNEIEKERADINNPVNTENAKASSEAPSSSSQKKSTQKNEVAILEEIVENSPIEEVETTVDDDSESVQIGTTQKELPQPIKERISIKLLAVGGALLSDYGTTGLAEDRTASLSQGFTLSGQLNFSYNLVRGIHLRTGLEYNKYSQLFQWSGQYVTDREGAYIGREVTPSLESQDYVLLIKERDIVKYNSRVFVDIPMGLSYRMQLGKIVLEPSVFAAFNVYNLQNGYSLNEQGIPQELDSYAYTYAPKLGLGLDVCWSIAERLGLVTRAAISRRKIEDGILEEVIVTPELSLGLHYGF